MVYRHQYFAHSTVEARLAPFSDRQLGRIAVLNVDYTLTLSRLPDGPHLGLASLTHSSHDEVATGSAVLVD